MSRLISYAHYIHEDIVYYFKIDRADSLEPYYHGNTPQAVGVFNIKLHILITFRT